MEKIITFSIIKTLSAQQSSYFWTSKFLDACRVNKKIQKNPTLAVISSFVAYLLHLHVHQQIILDKDNPSKYEWLLNDVHIKHVA